MAVRVVCTTGDVLGNRLPSWHSYKALQNLHRMEKCKSHEKLPRSGASSASSDAEGLGGSRSAGGGRADAPASKTASAEQEGANRPTRAQLSHVPASRPEETCVRASKACVRVFVVVLTAKIWRRSHTHQLGMDKWQFVHTRESHVAVRANVNSTRHTEGRPASESTRHAD